MDRKLLSGYLFILPKKKYRPLGNISSSSDRQTEIQNNSTQQLSQTHNMDFFSLAKKIFFNNKRYIIQEEDLQFFLIATIVKERISVIL